MAFSSLELIRVQDNFNPQYTIPCYFESSSITTRNRAPFLGLSGYANARYSNSGVPIAPSTLLSNPNINNQVIDYLSSKLKLFPDLFKYLTAYPDLQNLFTSPINTDVNQRIAIVKQYKAVLDPDYYRFFLYEAMNSSLLGGLTSSTLVESTPTITQSTTKQSDFNPPEMPPPGQMSIGPISEGPPPSSTAPTMPMGGPPPPPSASGWPPPPVGVAAGAADWPPAFEGGYPPPQSEVGQPPSEVAVSAWPWSYQPSAALAGWQMPFAGAVLPEVFAPETAGLNPAREPIGEQPPVHASADIAMAPMIPTTGPSWIHHPESVSEPPPVFPFGSLIGDLSGALRVPNVAMVGEHAVSSLSPDPDQDGPPVHMPSGYPSLAQFQPETTGELVEEQSQSAGSRPMRRVTTAKSGRVPRVTSRSTIREQKKIEEAKQKIRLQLKPKPKPKPHRPPSESTISSGSGLAGSGLAGGMMGRGRGRGRGRRPDGHIVGGIAAMLADQGLLIPPPHLGGNGDPRPPGPPPPPPAPAGAAGSLAGGMLPRGRGGRDDQGGRGGRGPGRQPFGIHPLAALGEDQPPGGLGALGANFGAMFADELLARPRPRPVAAAAAAAPREPEPELRTDDDEAHKEEERKEKPKGGGLICSKEAKPSKSEIAAYRTEQRDRRAAARLAAEEAEEQRRRDAEYLEMLARVEANHRAKKAAKKTAEQWKDSPKLRRGGISTPGIAGLSHSIATAMKTLPSETAGTELAGAGMEPGQEINLNQHVLPGGREGRGRGRGGQDGRGRQGRGGEGTPGPLLQALLDAQNTAPTVATDRGGRGGRGGRGRRGGQGGRGNHPAGPPASPAGTGLAGGGNTCSKPKPTTNHLGQDIDILQQVEDPTRPVLPSINPTVALLAEPGKKSVTFAPGVRGNTRYELPGSYGPCNPAETLPTAPGRPSTPGQPGWVAVRNPLVPPGNAAKPALRTPALDTPSGHGLARQRRPMTEEQRLRHNQRQREYRARKKNQVSL